MADNITFTDSGTGAVPTSTVIKTRQTSSGYHVQAADVAPMVLAAVSGGQYALSVSASTVRTLTVPSGATHAWISVDPSANTIRWTRDGTAPTASVGHALVAGEAIEVDNLSNFKAISTTGTSTIQVSYHRYV